jgi:uncharacterized protein YdhG (YjbR/CyaY superfamily)
LLVNAKPTDVDGYLATVPGEARARFEELRSTVKALAPRAVESISYGMPTFKYGGQRLAHFAAWKSHCALYGMNADAHRDELAAYDTSRGTIRFPLDEPLPEPLVKALVGERVAAIEAAAAERKRKHKRSGTGREG